MYNKRRATIHPTLRDLGFENHHQHQNGHVETILESECDIPEIITVQPSNKSDTSESVQFENPYNTIITNKFILEESLEGLEALVDTEHLFMRQSLILIDTPNPANLYEILNSNGDRIFFVQETTDFGANFCGGAQPFALKVSNRPGKAHYNKEIFQLKGHPSYCQCGGEIIVKKGAKKLGRVNQTSDFFTPGPRFSVLDPKGKEILKIIGPTRRRIVDNYCKHLPCLSLKSRILGENVQQPVVEEPEIEVDHSIEFDIISTADGQKNLGRIAKHTEGLIDGKYDVWGIRFPLEMDVTTKATLLGSLFLLDFTM